MKQITDEQFKTTVEIFLPEHIKIGNIPYSLSSYKILAGGYRILYWNQHLKCPIMVAFDEIWDDPLDCIKVMFHRLDRNIDTWWIRKNEFDELNEQFQILDKADKEKNKAEIAK